MPFRPGARPTPAGRRAAYQAIINGEDHIGRLDHLTALAGHIHSQLTSRKLLDIGNASGMYGSDIIRAVRTRPCRPA
jgi:hypothetical protein